MGTWQKCAVGLSGSRSPYLALDNYADAAGSSIRQANRSNSQNQKFWFDVYPNSGNRVDFDVWIRTA